MADPEISFGELMSEVKITNLKAQIKNPARVSVYVDGEYSFSLNQDQLLELKVRVGQPLEAQQLLQFKNASLFGKAYERALNYLMIRPRSTKEVKDYLQRKKVEPTDIRAIVDKLKSRNYLDDTDFARAWVQSRLLAKKTSLRKLKLELKQKGIDNKTTNSTLENYDEKSVLRNIIAKKQKISRYKNNPQKLVQYLIRQGFDYNEIRRCIESSD